MTPRNEDLYSAMKAFYLAFGQLLIRRIGGQCEESTHSEGSPSDVLEQVRRLPEYHRCIDELQKDSVISEHVGKSIVTAALGGYRGLTARDALEKFMGPIPEGKRPVLDDQHFERVYKIFEDTFYHTTFECEAIAPVQGWILDGKLQERAADCPLVKFTADLEISQLTAEEEKQVHQLELVRRNGPRWTDRTYAIRVKYQTPKIVVGIDEEVSLELQNDAQEKLIQINERVEEVLQTLRLFKQGNIRQGGIFHRANNWLVGNFTIFSNKPLADPLANLFPLYILDSEQDLDDLRTFWQAVQTAKTKGHRSLNVAMRRFSDSNERHRVEDRVIDLMIAAEALSQAGRSKMKGGVIAPYIASHFPRSEQGKVAGHLRDAYRLRNSIMHDGDASGWLKETGVRTEDLASFVNTAEYYLRQALRKVIERAAH